MLLNLDTTPKFDAVCYSNLQSICIVKKLLKLYFTNANYNQNGLMVRKEAYKLEDYTLVAYIGKR